MLYLILGILATALAQPQVVPAYKGVVPDGSLPTRRFQAHRMIPNELIKKPKSFDIQRQADDARGVGLSPQLQALQRLAGLNQNSQSLVPNQGGGASLSGWPTSLGSGSGLGSAALPNFGGSGGIPASNLPFGGAGGLSGLAGLGLPPQPGGRSIIPPGLGSLGLGGSSGLGALGGSSGLGALGGSSGLGALGGSSGLAGLGGSSGLGGLGGSSGLGGLGGALGGGGLGGLGGVPGLGSLLPQGIAGLAGVGGPQGQTGGLLNILGSLGGSLGRSLGIGSLLGQRQPNQFAGGSAGPTFAGVPAVPGVPIGSFQQPQGGFDFLNLIGSLARRAFNGSTVTDVLPPNRIQSLADNVTETLVPVLAEIDLTKYMGRWFEGINSPKSSEQRCPVHHYGGLTENGKTATFTALKIYRDGSEFGQVQYSIGYAFRGGRHPGMLQMHSSESRDPTPYWIYHAGPIGKDSFGNDQYEYVIVSNWIKYPVTVLVRDPDDFKKKYYVDVLRWLEDHGFITDFSRAFNLIQPADYSNCQYEDSTFAAFGK